MSERPLTRRTYLNLRRKARAGGRILAAGALTGLGTYAGLRLAAPVFRGTSRAIMKSTRLRKMFPAVAAATRRLGKHGAALEWGLAGGALAGGAKALDETKTAARRRYRRWLRGS